MEVNVHEAKTRLSQLIVKAEDGEEVIIARNGKPAVRLVPVAPVARTPRSKMIGAGIGKLWISPDFGSPEDKAEIAALLLDGADPE